MMRDNLERVSIVLMKDQHQRFKEYAKRCHGSLSQFLRMAAENEIDSNSGVDEVNLRPIIEILEGVRSMVQQIEGRLERIGRGTDFIIEKFGSRMEKVAGDVEELLLQKGNGLSIPEIGNYLPYNQNEIIQGIERLEEKFAVRRIEQVNAPSKWKIRGDKNDN